MKHPSIIAILLLCVGIVACSGLNIAEEQQLSPEQLETQPADTDNELSEDAENAEDAEKLNINFAMPEDFQLLPEIDEELAIALFEGRPYNELEDMLKVEGMTEELFFGIRDFLEIRKLNLNDATLLELQLLPGIDENIARAIIDNRPYKIVEEVLKIQGIGEKQLEKFIDQIEATPARHRDSRRGWNMKKRNFPVKIPRPLEKQPSEEPDNSR